jgi:tRNA threonylcarbamoyladenosine biosynthesis protein TsaE
MKHIVTSENDMQAFGRVFAGKLKGHETIELVGDVGAGKTTFVKGLAQGLGVREPVQSPSFVIFARYAAPKGRGLHHYDFYRLDDAGVVAYDLAESLQDGKAITVIEWANTISHVLPAARITIRIKPLSSTSRELDVQGLES